MNAQERLRVARLVTRLAGQAETPQDPDAALELATLLKIRPDAPYLLMQRALMLEVALEQAQLELQTLRQGAAAPPPEHYAAPLARPPLGGPATYLRRGPGAAAAGSGGAGGGLLRNAAAVGAGVVGGSLLFQGLQALLHDHDLDHGPVSDAGTGLPPLPDTGADQPMGNLAAGQDHDDSLMDDRGLLDGSDAGWEDGI